MKIFHSHNKSAGQIMVLTVLILGGAITTASVIAGFITTRNIRQATLANDSSRAIFAADAGLERLLYECFRVESCTGEEGTFTGMLDNNTNYEAVYRREDDVFTELRSVGYSDPTRRATRALKLEIQ